MMTDPVADMLTRVRNAVMVAHPTVSIPSSKMKEAIAGILASEGFVDSFDVQPKGPGRELTIRLKYGPSREKVINGIRRVSKPGTGSTAAPPSCPAPRAALAWSSYPPRRVCSPTARHAAAVSVARSCVRCGEMSRIGKMPVPVPAGVEVAVAGPRVTVKGPMGTLERDFPDRVGIAVEDGNASVARPGRPARVACPPWAVARPAGQHGRRGVRGIS